MIHKNYKKLTQTKRMHVDKMFGLLRDYMHDNDMQVIGDDRAEILVEAIATFIVSCEKD
jgi:hypothetical protein